LKAHTQINKKMTSSSSSGGGGGDKDNDLVDSLDDFLSNMDREREAINSRILAAYGEDGGDEGRGRRQGRRNDNFLEGSSHEPSSNVVVAAAHGAEENYDDDNKVVDRSSSSSVVSLLISERGDNDDSQEAQKNGPSAERGTPSYSSRNNDRNNNMSNTLKNIKDSKNSSKNSSKRDSSYDDVYNITQQSQQLYDKLNTSYNYHQKEDLEDTTSTATGGGLHTIPTMTTYNSSPSASSASYLESMCPPLVVKKIIEERGGGQQQQQKKQQLQTTGTIQEDIVQDVHSAGSKGSYDWVLQQLSSPKRKKREVDSTSVGHRETNMSLKKSAAATPTTAAVKQDAAAVSLTQQTPKSKGWFRNNNRVSILLRVNNQTPTKADAVASSEGDDNILFPMLLENGRDDNIHKKTELHNGKIVLVNPNIFNNDNNDGPMSLKKRLRGGGGATVETARLVARVSQISSTEDWARQYQFDDVIGMVGTDGSTLHDDDDAVNSLTSLAQQVTKEAIGVSRKFSTVLFAAGGTKSGKTRMVFGPFISDTIASVTAVRMEDPPSNLGLVGDIIQQVFKLNHQCSISILEIADDDVLRDILGFSESGLNEHRGTRALRLRHADKKRGGGSASVENLWQVSITSFEEACEIISDVFQSRSLRKIWREEGGHGHFVVTVGCSRVTGDDESCIQVVDLASPDCQVTTPSASRVSSIRKSLSALRGILRELAANHPNSSTASALPVSFRECTLTKVLQRNLEGRDTNGLSRAIVIGCVNPSSRDYSQTLRTMDFMTSISANASETTRSSFRDGSARPPPASSLVTTTPIQHESDGTPFLKSIVSDPRQRLAKLLTPQSNNKDGRKGTHEKTRDIATPRSSSTNSENMAQQRFRDTYNSVFDQLENLMSNEEEEDNIDRDSYGNTIIQAITPNPKSKSKQKLRPEPSPETETEDFFSPLYNLTPPVGRIPKSVKKGLTGENEMEGNNLLHDQRGVEASKQHFHPIEEVTKDAVDEVDNGTPLFSEIEFQRSSSSDGENWNEFSPVSSSHDRANQDVFVEKSKLMPLKTLISHDSMDSELLVSCRGNGNVKGGLTSSGLDSVDRPKASSTRHANTEAVVAEPDVSSMVESFQQEVDALIKKSPSSKYRSKDSGGVNSRSGERLASLLAKATNEGYSNTDSSVIRAEVVALKSMLDKFKEEKAATDSFVLKLQMIVDDTESDYFDVDTSFPSNCLSLVNSVRERQAMMVNLQRELDECKAENIEIARELERACTNRRFEKDLADQAKKSLALETELSLEKARAKELSSEKAVFFTLLREIDEKLDMGAPSKHDIASRQKLRMERMERMQSGLQQLFTKNQKLEMLLRESRDEGNKARKLVEMLKAKVDDMQSQANLSQGSNSRALEAAEKLAEEAVRDNEALTNEIAQMQDSITRIRNEYQSLSQKHQGVVARNAELYKERERLLAENDSETMAIREALDACREEKAQLEEQLASFSSKTAEMMKQRIDHVKEDYARRLSIQQARIKQLEDQGDMRRSAAISSVRNELSEKQSENEHLRKRIAEIEKATALKLQDTEAALARVQTELNEATDEARIQRDENATLQNELSHLRGVIDVAEQSVNEVNRLRIENDQLQESIRSIRDQQTHDTSFEVPFEIRGKRNVNNVSFLHDADEYFMKERVTALMRENEQNNISMRSLQVSWTQV
jgi:hypothetical protein